MRGGACVGVRLFQARDVGRIERPPPSSRRSAARTRRQRDRPFKTERTEIVATVSSPAAVLRRRLVSWAVIGVITVVLSPPRGHGAEETAPRLLDLSLIVARDYPCTWPTFPRFLAQHAERIG